MDLAVGNNKRVFVIALGKMPLQSYFLLQLIFTCADSMWKIKLFHLKSDICFLNASKVQFQAIMIFSLTGYG